MNYSTPFAVHLQKISIHLCPNLFQSFFNKRLSITEFAWALTINCIIIQPYPWRWQSSVRWDKHYSHNNIYFWKREYQICWTFYPSIASLLRHRGKYVCTNRDISPNFPRNFDYRTRDHMYFFFKHIVTILPFQIYVNSATYETVCVQLRGRTTVYVCHSDS